MNEWIFLIHMNVSEETNLLLCFKFHQPATIQWLNIWINTLTFLSLISVFITPGKWHVQINIF